MRITRSQMGRETRLPSSDSLKAGGRRKCFSKVFPRISVRIFLGGGRVHAHGRGTRVSSGLRALDGTPHESAPHRDFNPKRDVIGMKTKGRAKARPFFVAV